MAGRQYPALALLERLIVSLHKRIEDERFINEYKDSEQSFIRTRVFTFSVLLTFLMTNLQKGLQREIASFCEAINSDGGSIPEVSKAAFCKARKKLKPEAFVELSDVILEQFYRSDQVQRWNGYRLIAVDGSTAQLPASPAIQQRYGVFKYRDDGKPVCMGRMLTAYDPLNHLTLFGTIDKEETSEIAMLWEWLPKQDFAKGDLLILDRYFASHLAFFYLNMRKVNYCFRMKNNWWKIVEKFNSRGRSSQVLTLELPAKDRSHAAELGITKTKIRVRLVRVELDSGETEILLTSLINEAVFDVGSCKELYGLRWPVEESYKSFKHKVCIENFSGKSERAVLQDFYVKLFIMNLTAVAVCPINTALQKASVKVKHVHQVNFIEAIATMKKAVISFFITGTVTSAIARIWRRLLRCTEPIRKGRSSKRHKLRKRNHYMNYKPV